nr:hypothetical protein [Tanacetum cinerariifolium]
PMGNHGIAKWALEGGGDNRLRLGCLVATGIGQGVGIKFAQPSGDVVWICGVDKSSGPHRFTFEFFHKYWAIVGPDFSLQWNGFLKMEILLLDGNLRLWPSFQKF